MVLKKVINMKKRLLEQMSDSIRVKHYSIRTEKAYLDWVKRFNISSSYEKTGN